MYMLATNVTAVVFENQTRGARGHEETAMPFLIRTAVHPRPK